MSSLIQAENISKRFGDKLLFEHIDISINEGTKTALIAKNGTGKTTMLNILVGKDSSDSGKITKKRDLTIGYLPQDINFDPERTVLDSVFFSENEIINAIKEYNINIQSSNPNILQKSIDKMDRLNAWDYEVKTKQILSKLQINEFDKKIKHLSGGQEKRVALASVLISDPDILILDEPTNHLDVEMIEWLEDFLSNINKTVFMVTHDRYFLENVCNVIVEIDRGKTFYYQGNYSYFLEKRSERIESLHSTVSKAKNLMKTELEWIRRMPKARTSKSKYRVNDFENIKRTATQDLSEQKLELNIASERLGKKVIDLYNISKSYDNQSIIKDFSYKFVPGEKIGIIGNNGTGKSTLLNIITQEIKPDAGRIEYGSTVNIAYYKQEGIKFNEDDKPIDIISEISEDVKMKNGKSFSASGLLTHFLFPPEQQHTFVRKLSGGEKRRLYLCSLLIKQPNFIILDEPTNDFDIVSLQVLEDYLAQVEATVIIVSHDRYFMDKIVDHIFAFEDNNSIKDFPGNYTQYRNYQKEKALTEKKNQEKEKPKQVETIQKKDTSSKKMTYSERLESEKIESKLLELEEEKINLENKLNSGELDSNELQEIPKKYAATLEEIENLEMRWLELHSA